MISLEEDVLEHGRRYTITTDDGAVVAASVHDDGSYELELPAARARKGTPSHAVRIDGDDARRLGSVLTGTSFRPLMPTRSHAWVGDLLVDWVRIQPGAAACGLTLAQLDLHRSTGMTAIAIVRGTTPLRQAIAHAPLEAGDRVVVVGRPRQLPLLQDLLTR